MNANLDLRQLAVKRDGEIPALAHAARRRHLLTRFFLPGGVLLGFVAMLSWAARDHFLPAREVTIVPVIPATEETPAAAGEPLFQAAGWIEPRPTPVIVTALAEGVVKDLLVVEGQEVHAGEPVARLIDADARFALKAAEAEERFCVAECARAHAVRAAAQTNLEQPVQLQAALADAQAMLNKMETELATLPAQQRAADARLRLAKIDLERKRNASGSISDAALLQAQAESETAKAGVEELTAREPRLKREIESLTAKRDALRARLKLKTEETRALAEAEANVRIMEAKLDRARVAVDIARLRLERMTVRAPRNGRVLGLIARPGTRLMGLAPGTMQESSTVVTLYDPASLQVRADVRFEDVPHVRPGQAVRVETPAAPGGALEGEVLFATAISDIQKNTLQVKVALQSPPPTLKPDMLVQATFLALPRGKTSADARPHFLVPRALVETGDGASRVWVADRAAGVARRRAVSLGPGRGDLATVLDGLTAADKLIAAGRDGLRDDDRIRVMGEDASFGIATTAATPAAERIRRTPAGK